MNTTRQHRAPASTKSPVMKVIRYRLGDEDVAVLLPALDVEALIEAVNDLGETGTVRFSRQLVLNRFRDALMDGIAAAMVTR